MDNNIRHNIHKCAKHNVETFLAALKQAGYKQRSFFPAGEVSHFERYSYVKNNSKVGIVFDTKADILSITTSAETMQGVLNLYSNNGNNLSLQNNEPSPQPETKDTIIKTKAPTKNLKKPVKKTAEKALDNNNSQGVQSVQSASVPEYKNGFSIKKYPTERLERLLKRLKSEHGYLIKKEDAALDETAGAIDTYTITDKSKQKIFLRYMVKKQTVQLQGKRNNLFGEIQVLISKDSDYASAVNSHIEMSGQKTRASKLYSELKKRVPSAMEYLSEQSQIDISIALHDFNRENLELYDYSVLLVPPYRGLERFIYDLQISQGIEVKMIGQAFEKENGQYVLKSGYRKKINSIVYGEVMTALYTEYFEKRNFFAHSDNSFENRSRMIGSKQEAKDILDNLLKIIEYNSKKLKEILFSIKTKTQAKEN